MKCIKISNKNMMFFQWESQEVCVQQNKAGKIRCFIVGAVYQGCEVCDWIPKNVRRDIIKQFFAIKLKLEKECEKSSRAKTD